MKRFRPGLRRVLTFLLLATCAYMHLYAQQAHYRHHGPALLPDPKITPGAIRTMNAAEICAPDFRTGPFRQTTPAMKKQVYRLYGVERGKGICVGGCEIDHLVPLELGGLDSIKNLWPQPSQPPPASREKDELANLLRARVCAGKIPLSKAQHALRTDWYQAYLDAGLGKAPKTEPAPGIHAIATAAEQDFPSPPLAGLTGFGCTAVEWPAYRWTTEVWADYDAAHKPQGSRAVAKAALARRRPIATKPSHDWQRVYSRHEAKKQNPKENGKARRRCLDDCDRWLLEMDKRVNGK